MRKEMAIKHEKMLHMYAEDEQLLKFIEQTQRIYRQLDDVTLDFGDYLYNILCYTHDNLHRIKKVEEE